MFRHILTWLLVCSVYMISQGQQQSVPIAVGGSVTLRAHSEGALSYLWFYNGEPVAGNHENRIIADKPGRYTVIGLSNDCESELSDPVDVILNDGEPPVAVDMQIQQQSDQQRILQGSSFHYQYFVLNNSDHPATDVAVTSVIPTNISYAGPIGTYPGIADYDAFSRKLTWKPGNLTARQSVALRISLKAEQEGRAESWSEITAAEADPEPGNNRSSVAAEILTFRIPNLFTPNGDGQNDHFEISGLDLFPENELIIFNRWGNHVYRSVNYKNDWNGAGLSEGTYYYVLRIRLDNGTWQTFKGFLTIVRNVS